MERGGHAQASQKPSTSVNTNTPTRCTAVTTRSRRSLSGAIVKLPDGTQSIDDGIALWGANGASASSGVRMCMLLYTIGLGRDGILERVDCKSPQLTAQDNCNW